MASSAAVDHLTALPDAVLSALLAWLFSLEDIHTTTKAIWRHQLPLHIQVFASVCSAWKKLFHELASANKLSCFNVSLLAPTRTAVVELRRQLILRRAHTQRLNLARAPNVNQLRGVALWRSMLDHAPHTTLVDLTTVHKKSHMHLAQYLVAAGWQLPRVHTLHLPQYKVGDPDIEWMHRMTMAMMEALEAWSLCGEVDGLRVLRASLSDYMYDFRDSGEMMETLARYCPKLERLETNDGESGVSIEQWLVDLRYWQRFCGACSSLTEFDWVRVPFATAFFEIFGQNQQPKLTKLMLRSAVNWDWENFTREADAGLRAALTDRGFGFTVRNAFAVLKACPNLRELRVEWMFYSTNPKMDPEIFGVEFHEKLVTSCALLERFTSASRRYDNKEMEMIASLTDRSLDAFAKLPRLRLLELCAKNVSGDALFHLVVSPAMEHRCTKPEYRILIGNADEQPAIATFYDVLLRFLQRLVDVRDPLAFEVQPLSLWLVNHSSKTAGEEWFSHYLAQVKALVAQIKATHPVVRMRIALVLNWEGKWSHQMASFGFFTPDGETQPWNEGTFVFQYEVEPIDDVFVKYFGEDMYWNGDVAMGGAA